MMKRYAVNEYVQYCMINKGDTRAATDYCARRHLLLVPQPNGLSRATIHNWQPCCTIRAMHDAAIANRLRSRLRVLYACILTHHSCKQTVVAELIVLFAESIQDNYCNSCILHGK